MRYLLTLLDDGTQGTQAEPTRSAPRLPQNSVSDQRLARVRTRGTHATLENDNAVPDDHIVQHITDLADAYHERVAIVLEAGDIGEAEARCIAEAEIGRRFVETFIPHDDRRLR
jgi:hypothetical protein